MINEMNNESAFITRELLENLHFEYFQQDEYDCFPFVTSPTPMIALSNELEEDFEELEDNNVILDGNRCFIYDQDYMLVDSCYDINALPY